MATATPPAGTAPTPPGAPGRVATGTRGAKLLTLAGVALLLAGFVLGGLMARVLVQTLPFDVLAMDGGEGPGVVGAVPVPGSRPMVLDAGAYAVYLAHPASRTDVVVVPVDEISVTAADGATVPMGGPGTSSTLTVGGTTATTVAGFEGTERGTYVLMAELSAGPDVRLLVVDDPGFGGLLGGVLGTVAGVLTAVVLGAVGLGLSIAGGILWFRRTDRGAQR